MLTKRVLRFAPTELTENICSVGSINIPSLGDSELAAHNHPALRPENKSQRLRKYLRPLFLTAKSSVKEHARVPEKRRPLFCQS